MMNVQSTNTPSGVNSGHFDDPAPHEALMDGNIVDVDPLDEAIIDVIPMNETVINETPINTSFGSLAALLDLDLSERLRTRWNDIQGRFVDEPRSAVQQADALVSEVVEKITQIFADEHGLLESQWKQGNDVSTEDLRKALQHYRSFFNRLVV